MDGAPHDLESLLRLLHRAHTADAVDSPAASDVCARWPTAHIADGSAPPKDECAAVRAIFVASRQVGAPESTPSPGCPELSADWVKLFFSQLLSKATRTTIQRRVIQLVDLRTDAAALDTDSQLVAIRVGRLVGPVAARQFCDGLPEFLSNNLGAAVYLYPLGDTTRAAAVVKNAAQTVLLNVLTSGTVPAVRRRQALPAYAIRPYLVQQCCLTAPAPVGTGGGTGSGSLLRQLAYLQLLVSTTPSFAVTFGDRRQLQEYKAGLLLLVDAFLACLLRMLVVLLAALAHQATAPAFLLIMLATARHYGRRGDPDHLSLPVALIFDQQRGAVRLTA
jgi:hypothetical protein